MECYYGRYSPEERAGLALMAKRHDIVATGGSTFTGASNRPPGRHGTGDLDVPDTAISELLDRKPR